MSDDAIDPDQFDDPITVNAVAAIAKAEAEVKTRYETAHRYKRNMDQVRQLLLRECENPVFADNKSTIYLKPGINATGLGIRFAEVAMRCMGNMQNSVSLVSDSPQVEIWTITVSDLETNIHHDGIAKMSKTVERSKPHDDGTHFGVRKNSNGKAVYTVTATEDDLVTKRAANFSKTLRSTILRHIPNDLQDEATAVIKRVRKDKTAKDPDGARERLLDGFASLGILPEDLAEYLGYETSKMTPDVIVDMNLVLGAVDSGEDSWQRLLENAIAERKGAPIRTPARKTAEGRPEDPVKGESSQETSPVDEPENAGDQPSAPSAPAQQASEQQAHDPTLVTIGERKWLERKLADSGRTVEKAVAHFKIADWEQLTKADWKRIKEAIK